jgi:FkbM family methyltransferase
VWRHQHQGAGRLANEHIAWILRELDINCVLDVGANKGQYGRRLRRAGYQGRIVSFEPVREFLPTLRDLASKDPDWHVFEVALGDADTELEINSRPGQMSSLLPSSEWGEQWHERLRIAEKERISVRRLDGLFDTAIDGLDEPRTTSRRSSAPASASVRSSGCNRSCPASRSTRGCPGSPSRSPCTSAPASRSPACSRSPVIACPSV